MIDIKKNHVSPLLMPWLSILIPAYNAERFILATLESIFSQVSQDVEIIILDDASTDNTLNIINTLAAQHSVNIKVLVSKKNVGVSAARNTLLEIATGEYVWFIDADDWLAPDAIKLVREAVTAYNPDWVVFDYAHNFVDSPNVKTHYIDNLCGLSDGLNTDNTALFRGMFASGKLHLWSRVIKRSVWPKELRFPVGLYFEDMALTPRLALHAKSFYYIKRALLSYTMHDKSIVNKVEVRKVSDMGRALDGVLDYWRQAGLSIGTKDEYFFILNNARVYINSCKMLESINQLDDKTRKLLAQRFYSANNKTKFQTILFYLKHMQIPRLIRLCKYL